MEVDSVHSCIENACKKQEAYAPTDYYKIIAMARRGSPYEVHVSETEHFMDYKTVKHDCTQPKNYQLAPVSDGLR